MTFYTINTKQRITGIPLEKKTDAGADLDLTPAPVWSFETGPTDPCTIAVGPDGFSADIVPGTVPGDSIFLVQAFSGGVAISGEITVTVNPAPDLGNLVFGPGTIEPK